jgi:hypothetical protein
MSAAIRIAWLIPQTHHHTGQVPASDPQVEAARRNRNEKAAVAAPGLGPVRGILWGLLLSVCLWLLLLGLALFLFG